MLYDENLLRVTFVLRPSTGFVIVMSQRYSGVFADIVSAQGS